MKERYRNWTVASLIDEIHNLEYEREFKGLHRSDAQILRNMKDYAKEINAIYQAGDNICKDCE